MIFVLPIPPQQANARGRTWRTQYGKKIAYWKVLDALQLLGGIDGCEIPSPPREPWKHATIAAHWYVINIMDEGNCMNRAKYIEDWLVTRGYIADDNRKVLRWAGIPEQEIDRKHPRVVVTLEQVDE